MAMSSLQAPPRRSETLGWVIVVVFCGGLLALLTLTGIIGAGRVSEILLFDAVAVVAASLLANITCKQR